MQDQAGRLAQQVRRFKIDGAVVATGAEPQARLIETGRATPHPPPVRKEPVVSRPALNHSADDNDDWSSF